MSLSLLFGVDPLYQVLGGGLMIGAFFMATDYTTSPITEKGKIIFGLGCALITMVIRVFGSYPEGVSYSILLMNIITPHINRMVRNKRLEVCSSNERITMNEFVKPTLVLTVICLIITLLLAISQNITEPIIEENNRRIAEESRAEVLAEQILLNRCRASSRTVYRMYMLQRTDCYTITVSSKGYSSDPLQ